MAIIIGAGWAKGMKLEAPEGDTTRPTGAKVRAAVLNSLASRLEDARVLDLFAGSGALGIEALSRGAAACAFVEVATAPAKCMAKNLAELERRALAQRMRPPDVWVIRRDAAAAVTELARGVAAGATRRFNVIFADPPYDGAQGWATRLAPELATVAAKDAEFWVETDSRTTLAEAGAALGDSPWRLVRSRAYGDTMVHVFSMQAASATEAET